MTIMESRTLKIQVKSASKMLLLGGAASLTLVAAVTWWLIDTGNITGVTGDFSFIAGFAAIAAIFFLLLWVNASFENVYFGEDEVTAQMWPFFKKTTPRALIDGITIGERSSSFKIFANGKRFATMNFSIIDVTQEELMAFCEMRNIPVDIEADK